MNTIKKLIYNYIYTLSINSKTFFETFTKPLKNTNSGNKPQNTL